MKLNGHQWSMFHHFPSFSSIFHHFRRISPRFPRGFPQVFHAPHGPRLSRMVSFRDSRRFGAARPPTAAAIGASVGRGLLVQIGISWKYHGNIMGISCIMKLMPYNQSGTHKVVYHEIGIPTKWFIIWYSLDISLIFPWYSNWYTYNFHLYQWECHENIHHHLEYHLQYEYAYSWDFERRCLPYVRPILQAYIRAENVQFYEKWWNIWIAHDICGLWIYLNPTNGSSMAMSDDILMWILVGAWSLPLWTIWVCQSGWWHSQNIWRKCNSCSRPPTSSDLLHFLLSILMCSSQVLRIICLIRNWNQRLDHWIQFPWKR